MARRPARKMITWKPSPAQIAGARTDGNAWVVERRNGCCPTPMSMRIRLKTPTGAG